MVKTISAGCSTILFFFTTVDIRHKLTNQIVASHLIAIFDSNGSRETHIIIQWNSLKVENCFIVIIIGVSFEQ